MTETNWLGSTDTSSMLAYLGGRVSDRKLRLFACACARRIWHLLPDQRSRRAIEVAEQCADGQVAPHQLPPHYDAASDAAATFSTGTPWFAAARAAADAVRSYPPNVRGMMARAANAGAGAAAAALPPERNVQARFLRDIVGNPFRLVAIQPGLLTWNDGALPKMAWMIYRDRAFDCLPILADALEDAGCDSADILSHCRKGGEHVRGCWVLDLLLGKE